MALDIFWKGILIGLSISVPLGPIGMLCIQRTLNRGRRAGLATGFGATTSDIVYAIITMFFLSFVLGLIEQYQFLIQLGGSVIIIFFGIWIYNSNPIAQPQPHEKQDSTMLRDYFTSFALTLSNPLILFILIALFAQTGYTETANSFWAYVLRLLFIVFGAGMWWLLLTWMAGRFRYRFNLRGLKLINRITGAAIASIGLLAIIMSLIKH